MTSLACNKRSSSIRTRKNPRWRQSVRALHVYTGLSTRMFCSEGCSLCIRSSFTRLSIILAFVLESNGLVKWIQMNSFIYIYILLEEDKGNTIKFCNNKSSSWLFAYSIDATFYDSVWNEKKDRYTSSFEIRCYTTRRERSKKFQGSNWEIVRAVIHHMCSLTWRIYNSLQVCEGERYERA